MADKNRTFAESEGAATGPEDAGQTQLKEQAAVILSRTWQQAVQITSLELLKNGTRQAVYRCRVEGGPVASVVLKQIQNSPAQGFSDWAGLAFLSGQVKKATKISDSDNRPFPLFYGGDVASGLLLMEDLGRQGLTVEDALNQDKETAVSALVRLAGQMGRLHKATAGAEADYRAQRETLPAAEGLGRQGEAQRWRQALPRFLAWPEALGLSLPAGLDRCLEQVAGHYAEPGRLLAFSHGDPAPSNNYVSGERVCLLDFEYGDYRHLFYDITGWDILCPLPSWLLLQMQAAFRREIGTAFPTVQEPDKFAAAWAGQCAYRAVAILTWLSPALLEENRQWASPAWTAREALLAALGRLAARAGVDPALAPLGEVAAGMHRRLLAQWPEYSRGELVPAWPAFAG